MTQVTLRFHKVITTWNLAAQYPLIMLILVNGRNKTYQKRIVSRAIILLITAKNMCQNREGCQI